VTAQVAAATCRVLGVVGQPLSAVGYLRFAQPFSRLGERGFELRTLGSSLTLTRGRHGFEIDPALLDSVSLVIFPQMVADPVLADGTRVEVVRPLCEAAARRGIKIVYSVDDYLPAIEASNPGYERVRGSIDNLDTLREHAAAVIVTTEELRRSLAAWNRPVHLLPNTVDPDRLGRRPRTATQPRIGWAGSGSHLEDLLAVAPALAQLQQRVAYRLVLHGLTDVPFDAQAAQIRRSRAGFTHAQRARAERFLELRSLLDPLDYEHRPFVPIDAFLDGLRALDLDIGICPLLDTPFNRHKSAIKFYEYAATDSLTVASRVDPYASEVEASVPNDVQAWCECLERYLRDRPALERELARQREFVLAERTVGRWVEGWERVLTEILDAPA
jgi:glycosyltransferase involved in cell wall biosynthesis